MALGEAYNVVGVGAGGALGAEAVVVTSPIMPASPQGGSGNLLRVTANFPNAVATAVITLKVRQTSISGTVVGTLGPITVGTAAAGAVVAGTVVDLGAQAGNIAQYVLTGTGSGGTSGTGATYTLEIAPAGLDG